MHWIKKEIMRIWLVIILLLFGFQANSQIQKPVKWSFSSKQLSDKTYDLILKASMEKPWHLYSQHIGEGGPVPTSFKFNNTDQSYSLVGDVKEKGKAIKINDPSFDNMEVIYYQNEVSFVQRVKLLKPVTGIEGSLEFMTCNDKMCLAPETVPFKIALDKNGAFKPVPLNGEKAAEGTGKNTGENKDKPVIQKEDPVKWTSKIKSIKDKEYEIWITATIAKGYHLNAQDQSGESGCKAPKVVFNSTDSVDIIGDLTTKNNTVVIKEDNGQSYAAFDNTVTFVQKIKLLKKKGSIGGIISYNACNNTSCSTLQQAQFTIDLPKEKIMQSHGDQSLSFIFWICFLGGIAALLTPCVFPMIPLTVSFFTKQSENKSKGVGSALLFGASIMFIYVGLGLLITVVFGPNALNDLASNVYTNLAFFLIFSIFAFSFLGAFDISLPSSWANKADAKAEKGGIIGIFFIALTLTIVSFSCTSLVIGNLLILAAKGGGYTGPAIGMIGFSLAWAIPFTLFAMFPSLMQKLPKSGGWLNAVKVTLGFIELALALKFLSTADITYHWGLLKREYFLALWIIIFGMLGFYLLGKIKLSHDTPVAHLSVTRLMMSLIALAFTLYMIPGLWGAPVELLSGIAPPSGYSEWIHDESGPSNHPATASNEKAHKYQEIFHTAKTHGLDLYYDYDEALAAARAEKKPLMVDFTGWACSNCRRMEDNVWSSSNVLPKLKNDYIIVSLYVDEKYSLPDNEVFTSTYNGNKITTLGEKWKDMQASRYGANSQPFYVLLDNNENKIGQYDGYDPSIDKFTNFLDSGQAKFKSEMTASLK
jgi:thiol:disulfide interchange protein